MSNYFLNFLEARKRYLDNIIEEKKNSLVSAPEGRLRTSTCRGKVSYYHVTEFKDTKGRYINKDNDGLIDELAQKKYDKDAVKACEDEEADLDRLIIRQKSAVEELYDKMPEAFKRHITPIREPDDEYIRKWLARSFEPMGFSENDPVIKSLKGLRIRSKSERLWADSFDKFNVPFIFEPTLYLEGYGWVRPDFCALNVQRRKEIYVENLGMMDDPGYAEDNVRKIRAYENNGFYLGDRLVITMETLKNPVNPRTVEDLIGKYFK